MADLEEYTVSYYPRQKTILEQILADLSNEVQTRILKMKLGELYPYFEQIRELIIYNGLQARIPYKIKID
jgi:protease-4